MENKNCKDNLMYDYVIIPSYAEEGGRLDTHLKECLVLKK